MAPAKKSASTSSTKASPKAKATKEVQNPKEEVLKTENGRVLTEEEQALLAKAKEAKAQEVEEAVAVESSEESDQEEVASGEGEAVESEPAPEPQKEESGTSKMIKEKAKEASAKLAEQMKGKAFAKAKEIGKKGFGNVLAMAKKKAIPKGKAMAGKAMKAVTFKKLLTLFKK